MSPLRLSIIDCGAESVAARPNSYSPSVMADPGVLEIENRFKTEVDLVLRHRLKILLGKTLWYASSSQLSLYDCIAFKKSRKLV